MASQNLFYQPGAVECEPAVGSTIRDALLKTQMIVEEIQCEVTVIRANLFGQRQPSPTLTNDPPPMPIGEPSCALDIILHNLDNLNQINGALKNICDRLGCV